MTDASGGDMSVYQTKLPEREKMLLDLIAQKEQQLDEESGRNWATVLELTGLRARLKVLRRKKKRAPTGGGSGVSLRSGDRKWTY